MQFFFSFRYLKYNAKTCEFFLSSEIKIPYLFCPRFVQFSGIAGVIGGISVAFKQIIPDQKINLKIHTIRVCVSFN